MIYNKSNVRNGEISLRVTQPLSLKIFRETDEYFESISSFYVATEKANKKVFCMDVAMLSCTRNN